MGGRGVDRVDEGSEALRGGAWPYPLAGRRRRDGPAEASPVAARVAGTERREAIEGGGLLGQVGRLWPAQRGLGDGWPSWPGVFLLTFILLFI